MKSKRLVVIPFIALMLFNGCGEKVADEYKDKSKADLVLMYEKALDDYIRLSMEYDEISSMHEAFQSESSPTAAIRLTGDGTGRFTFNSVDSKIIFPNSFKYPNSEQSTGNGYIHIVDQVKVQTGSNWISKLSSANLELEHNSGISGTIKIGDIEDSYGYEDLKVDVISQWFDTIPESNVKYTKIHVDEDTYGCQAVTKTLIDDENAYIRCGMIGYDGLSVTYVFVYRGDKDTTKDECITTLLNSLEINGGDVLVEQ